MQAFSRWLLKFQDGAVEAAFRTECKRLHRPLEQASLIEPLIYCQLAYKLWSGGAFVLVVANLLIAGALGLKGFLALARPHLDPSWRDALVGILHPLQLLSCSLFIRHCYVPICEPALAFWAAQFVVSSLPWLILVPLTSGLLFRHLLLVQAVAVAVVVATGYIRCGMCEAACGAAGQEQFSGAADLLAQLSSPFLLLTAQLSPRAACYAVLSLKQITLGYFLVLWVKYWQEVESRRRFAVWRGLQDMARQLERIATDNGPWGLGMYFVTALTWHSLMFVVQDWG